MRVAIVDRRVDRKLNSGSLALGLMSTWLRIRSTRTGSARLCVLFGRELRVRRDIAVLLQQGGIGEQVDVGDVGAERVGQLLARRARARARLPEVASRSRTGCGSRRCCQLKCTRLSKKPPQTRPCGYHSTDTSILSDDSGSRPVLLAEPVAMPPIAVGRPGAPTPVEAKVAVGRPRDRLAVGRAREQIVQHLDLGVHGGQPVVVRSARRDRLAIGAVLDTKSLSAVHTMGTQLQRHRVTLVFS
jgi:hypothetical protein